MTTPSEQEEQWFKDQELKARREREAAEAAAAGTSSGQAHHAHYMKCPKCGGNLSEHDHEGIKIDSCNDCKGVWLDAGELEQLTAEKSSGLLGFLRGRK